MAYEQKKKSDWKKYKDGSVKLAVSIFRKGRSYLAGKIRDFKLFLRFLSKLLKKSEKPYWIKMKHAYYDSN